MATSRALARPSCFNAMSECRRPHKIRAEVERLSSPMRGKGNYEAGVGLLRERFSGQNSSMTRILCDSGASNMISRPYYWGNLSLSQSEMSPTSLSGINM